MLFSLIASVQGSARLVRVIMSIIYHYLRQIVCNIWGVCLPPYVLELVPETNRPYLSMQLFLHNGKQYNNNDNGSGRNSHYTNIAITTSTIIIIATTTITFSPTTTTIYILYVVERRIITTITSFHKYFLGKMELAVMLQHWTLSLTFSCRSHNQNSAGYFSMPL